MSLEEHDVEHNDQQSRAEQPVILPPPPLVPVGPLHDTEDEHDADEGEDEPRRAAG